MLYDSVDSVDSVDANLLYQEFQYRHHLFLADVIFVVE